MPKPYFIKDFLIQVMDVNSTPHTLGKHKQALLASPFAFIVNPAEYQFVQTEGQGHKTPHLLIQGFQPAKLDKSMTWRSFLQTTSGSQPDFWGLQVPFYVRLRHHDLRLKGNTPYANEVDKIDSFMWLNAFGWSIQVELRLKHDLSFKDAQDFLCLLQTKECWVLNEKILPLRGLFGVYRENLVKDGYLPAREAAKPANSCFVCVDTPLVGGSLTGIETISTLDLEQLVEILLPRHLEFYFEFDDYGRRLPRLKGTTIAVFGDDLYNLSFSDFNKGTFTFFQDTIENKSLEVEVLSYARNVSDFTWLREHWLANKQFVPTVKPTAEMKTLLENGINGIKGLTAMITNPTISSMCATDKRLKEI